MADESKLTIKDIYKELWKCRNFELDHLWQRSVFLAAFLLAIAAGYGTFVNDHIKDIFPPWCGISETAFHGICLGLCVLGILFSQLWIMMIKGSKKWYEKYEKSISWFYDDAHDEADSKVKLFEPALIELIKDDNIHDSIPYFTNLKKRDIDDSLLSTKGGNFSVSKVNIFIGILMCFVWMALACVHGVLLALKTKSSLCWCGFAIPIVSVIIFAFFSKLFISHFFTHSEDD